MARPLLEWFHATYSAFWGHPAAQIQRTSCFCTVVQAGCGASVIRGVSWSFSKHPRIPGPFDVVWKVSPPSNNQQSLHYPKWKIQCWVGDHPEHFQLARSDDVAMGKSGNQTANRLVGVYLFWQIGIYLSKESKDDGYIRLRCNVIQTDYLYIFARKKKAILERK